MTTKGGLTFDQWMKLVDEHIKHQCGMTSNDLPDWLYWDAWNKGRKPEAAAKAAIKAARDY
jgi:hypothetical protein